MNTDLIWQGGGGIAGVGITIWILKTWAARIEVELAARAKKVDLTNKADIALCELKHKQIDIDMRKGDIRFDRIEDKLNKLGDASKDTHAQLERIFDAINK